MKSHSMWSTISAVHGLSLCPGVARETILRRLVGTHNVGNTAPTQEGFGLTSSLNPSRVLEEMTVAHSLQRNRSCRFHRNAKQAPVRRLTSNILYSTRAKARIETRKPEKGIKNQNEKRSFISNDWKP